ncbi:unnamed protein product [Sphenostylis stenocarpa]|uniref:MATH domain-containing protein n=1 Tax=Sphenostylis stenocarpa TaxID=92480 RepID=A0AA86T084_9FABA|nr:unnamed protein product [Sphenostylis stenocarpa]
MENKNTKDKIFEKFTWTIRDFSKLDSNGQYSEIFSIDDHLWRVLIFPKGNNVEYLSIYLDGGGNVANLETEHQFNAKEINWGFTRFIPLDELCNPSNGFIVNDTCIIEVEILVSNSKHNNEGDQEDNKINDKQTNHIDNPLPKEIVKFRGLEKMEEDFIPLLEEVCSQHPSLVDRQKKRTLMYVEWAFTALGRVLHFLKTKKVKDMDDDACNHLQVLWEELETFKFDLTWLEPHVQSALGMKNYRERSIQVKKMKEKVSFLETETKMLKEKMMQAKINLEITRRELARIIEGFEECNLEDGLGYGGQ